MGKRPHYKWVLLEQKGSGIGMGAWPSACRHSVQSPLKPGKNLGHNANLHFTEVALYPLQSTVMNILYESKTKKPTYVR